MASRASCTETVNKTSYIRASHNCGSRGVTAAALFTLTLFRRGRIIHEATYFEDAGQRSPVADVAAIVQYDSGIAEPHSRRAANAGLAMLGKQPSRVARHRALYADKLSANSYKIISSAGLSQNAARGTRRGVRQGGRRPR